MKMSADVRVRPVSVDWKGKDGVGGFVSGLVSIVINRLSTWWYAVVEPSVMVLSIRACDVFSPVGAMGSISVC